jgi:hypothetical protein
MAIKYTDIFRRKTLQNLPKLVFLVWKQNKPSGNPGRVTLQIELALHSKCRWNHRLWKKQPLTFASRGMTWNKNNLFEICINWNSGPILQMLEAYKWSATEWEPMRQLSPFFYICIDEYFEVLWSDRAEFLKTYREQIEIAFLSNL